MPPEFQCVALRCTSMQLKTSKSLPTKCRVVEVFPSSPADMAGVRVGDLVIRVDEQETQLLSKKGLSALLQQSAVKAQVCLVIVRPTTSGPQSIPVSNNIEQKDARKSVHFEGPGTSVSIPASAPSHLPKRLPPVTIANYETGEKHTDSLFAKAAVVGFGHAYLRAPLGSPPQHYCPSTHSLAVDQPLRLYGATVHRFTDAA